MRCSIASFLLVGSFASAQGVDPNVLLDACLKEKKLEMCRDLTAVKDNGEKLGTNTLKNWGILNAATIAGVLYKVGTEKKITFVDKTNNWYLPANERHIEISKDKVFLVLLWPLPW